MRFECIGSSSAGNAYWIELDRSSERPVRLLMEAGISRREIMTHLLTRCSQRISLSSVDACIVTHGHKDHSLAAAELARSGVRVYGNRYVCSSNDTLCEEGKVKVVAPDTFVLPFAVEHDAPDSFGYFVRTDVESFVFVNDCKYWRADLSSLRPNYVFIEANYDGETVHFALEEARENGDANMVSHYERILHSHMSIKNAIEALKKMDLSECRSVFLMHLSDKNSRQLDFKYRAGDALSKVRNGGPIPVYVCRKNGGII